MIKTIRKIICLTIAFVMILTCTCFADVSSSDSTMHEGMLNAPTSISAVSTGYDKIKVTWEAVSDADGYRIYVVDPVGGINSTDVDSDVLSYTFSGMKTGQTYSFKIASLKAQGEQIIESENCSPVASSESILGTPLIVKIHSYGKTAVKLAWTKVEGATYYQVYRYSYSTKKWVCVSSQIKSNTIINKGLSKGQWYGYKVVAYTDSNDISAHGEYSQTLKLKAGYANPSVEGNLLIVNKRYPLWKSYKPSKLKRVKYAVGKQYMSKDAATAFDSMARAAKKSGVKFVISNGYRSYALQKYLYKRAVRRNGKKYADKSVAKPGYSEHQSGLAADVVCKSTGYRAKSKFAKTAQYRWLKKNCYKYGFIIRYPKNKSKITGYMYESWHVRYVGKEAAKAIHTKKITLEECLGRTK